MTINTLNFDDLDSPIQIYDDALDIGDPLPDFDIELLLGSDAASFDVSDIETPSMVYRFDDVGISDDELLEAWFCQSSDVKPSRCRVRSECADQYRLFA